MYLFNIGATKFGNFGFLIRFINLHPINHYVSGVSVIIGDKNRRKEGDSDTTMNK